MRKSSINKQGRRYFCNRKDEIIRGLSPSVKCVASLLETSSFPKYEMQEWAPLPPRCAPVNKRAESSKEVN